MFATSSLNRISLFLYANTMLNVI